MKGNDDKIWTSSCFEQSLTRILNSRKKTVLPRLNFTVAAVLFPIYYKDGAPTVLLTRRSDLVEHHKGEISFPGGKMDDTDPDLLSCALRETAEEVGIRPEDVRILGELDDFYTVATSYLVAPFVGTLPYPYEFKPSAREIDEVLGVPLEVFFDPSRRSEETWRFQGRDIEVVVYKWQGHNIWGATARILKHFTELIEHGRPEFSVCASEGASDGLQ
ncbi:MAG: CoA pyrophosphatase [Deltaproteobacteria bacterium]|nr:CoA pyrophosphatase [Deltaproteobacteria bacterium]